MIAALMASGCGSLTAADTVDLGDNPEAVDLAIDEDFFYCVIQPEVITEYRCAQGTESDGGGCHASRSALRLIAVEGRPRCSGGRVLGAPPPDAEVNIERVRTTLGIDAESSPFYRRTVGLDSHPRKIFDEDSEPAQRIRQWLDRGAQ